MASPTGKIVVQKNYVTVLDIDAFISAIERGVFEPLCQLMKHNREVTVFDLYVFDPLKGEKLKVKVAIPEEMVPHIEAVEGGFGEFAVVDQSLSGDFEKSLKTLTKVWGKVMEEKVRDAVTSPTNETLEDGYGLRMKWPWKKNAKTLEESLVEFKSTHSPLKRVCIMLDTGFFVEETKKVGVSLKLSAFLTRIGSGVVSSRKRVRIEEPGDVSDQSMPTPNCSAVSEK